MSAGDLAARLARGTLADVPPEALREGLRLPLHDFLGLELTGLAPVVVEVPLAGPVRSLGLPLHGGVVATLVDVAAAVAAATCGAVDVSRHGLVTARLALDLRAQPLGGPVRAQAEVTSASARSVQSRCTVRDGRQRVLAVAEVTTRVVPRAAVLSPDAPW